MDDKWFEVHYWLDNRLHTKTVQASDPADAKEQVKKLFPKALVGSATIQAGGYEANRFRRY